MTEYASSNIRKLRKKEREQQSEEAQKLLESFVRPSAANSLKGKELTDKDKSIDRSDPDTLIEFQISRTPPTKISDKIKRFIAENHNENRRKKYSIVLFIVYVSLK